MRIMAKKRILILFTIVALVLVGAVSAGGSHSAPNAFDFCSGMGSNMGRANPGITSFNSVTQSDAPNRKWTVEELFRKSAVFTSYYGEGEGDWIHAHKVDRGLDRVGEANWNASGVQDNIKSARSLSCVIGKGDFLAVLPLRISGAVINIINSSISMVIGEDVLVEGLVEIIGGTDTSTGLIETFRNSIYMPLVIIAAALMAITIIYKGLIQLKLREALMSLIWSVLAFVIGLTLMFSPKLLAGAPQQITSTIATCVIGALNGQNCLSGDVTTPSLLAGVECRSEIAGDDSNNADTIVNGMNCTIWKSFVLEPWAEEQFGAPYSELYTHNIPEGGKLWTNLPEGQGEQYCVNLASTGSAESSKDSPIVMDLNDNSTVCNVALYQMYLKTEMVDPINHGGDSFKLTVDSNKSSEPYDARWYDIIVPMAQDSSNWANWSGQGRLLDRIGTANMGLFAVILASLILAVLSVFGAAYKIISVIMMAFAPLFLLFAIEPTRGRKIFLGWLETLVSSVLKYFAVTILIIVSLILYSGVLSNTTGRASFISVIILTSALLMYRKEVIDLIGASNMGGQRLSNRAAKTVDWGKNQFKQKGSALVGGAIGGRSAALANRKQEIKNREDTVRNLQSQLNQATSEEDEKIIKDAIDKEEAIIKGNTKFKAGMAGVAQGGGESLGRIMKRGTSIPAAAFRQRDATRRKLEKADNSSERTNKGMPGTPPNSPGTNSGDNGGDNQNKITLDSQRDKVEYTGNVNKKEKEILNNFADEISKMTQNDELLDLTKDNDLMNDINKKALVANEINARLKYNSLNNKPSGELSRHPLANNKYVSDEELELNIEMHSADFIESGNKEDYEKFQSAMQEDITRRIKPESQEEMMKEMEKDLEKRRKIAVIAEETGMGHERSVKVPTEEEYKANPEKYIPGNVTTPENLVREHKNKQSSGESKTEDVNNEVENEVKTNPIKKEYKNKEGEVLIEEIDFTQEINKSNKNDVKTNPIKTEYKNEEGEVLIEEIDFTQEIDNTDKSDDEGNWQLPDLDD